MLRSSVLAVLALLFMASCGSSPLPFETTKEKETPQSDIQDEQKNTPTQDQTNSIEQQYKSTTIKTPENTKYKKSINRKPADAPARPIALPSPAPAPHPIPTHAPAPSPVPEFRGVWKATNQWNSSYEKQYSHWISHSYNDNFYIKGKYKGIPTDCADAAYIARIIFSYENKLPFVMKDHTDARGRLITNKKTRWAAKPPMKRLISFVKWVGGNIASSVSITNDTYPVKINRTNVTPGSVYSMRWITRSGSPIGHVLTIKNILRTGRVRLLGSTTPRKVRRLLETYSFPVTPTSKRNGIRKWKQPKHYNGSPMKGRSYEQFTSSFLGEMDWESAVKKRLQKSYETREESMAYAVKGLCNRVHARIQIVKDADNLRKRMNRCMNAQQYDDYSTPSRDGKILEAYNSVRSLIIESQGGNLEQALHYCPDINYRDGKRISLSYFIQLLINGKISSDPNVPLAVRWGEYSYYSRCPEY